ncbi:MAG: MmgE/PrpD family protein [Lachnospiraceae bacterium]
MRRLAEFIHDITWDQLPERVRETAALRVLDLVSVAAGAAKDPLVEAAKEALGMVSGCQAGNAGLWIAGRDLSPSGVTPGNIRWQQPP